MERPNFSLRPFHPGDIPALARYANNRRIWLNVRDLFPHPYTEENARWFIEDYLPNSTDEEVFAIATEDEAIGAIGIKFKTDVYRFNAEIGFWLGEPFWGKGIATQAVGRIVDYIYRHYPSIVRIYAEVFDHNPASARVLLKNDFKQEATLSRAIIKDGQIEDLHIFSRLTSNQ